MHPPFNSEQDWKDETCGRDLLWPPLESELFEGSTRDPAYRTREVSSRLRWSRRCSRCQMSHCRPIRKRFPSLPLSCKHLAPRPKAKPDCALSFLLGSTADPRDGSPIRHFWCGRKQPAHTATTPKRAWLFPRQCFSPLWSRLGMMDVGNFGAVVAELESTGFSRVRQRGETFSRGRAPESVGRLSPVFPIDSSSNLIWINGAT